MSGALPSGFLIIDKPAGITSHDLVAMARKKLGTKKIGHAGTLDPMATGVMVLGIESATRQLNYILAGRKRYLATIKLGELTSTDDREGEVIERSAPLSIDEVKAKLAAMVGKILQVPSSVSALKVDGKRAHERVREGEKVELAPREVEIFVIEILSESESEIEVDVVCSPGTYIRAIARDIGGHLTSLRRIESAPFTVDDCREIDADEILTSAHGLEKIMPLRHLSFDELAELKFGRALSSESHNFGENAGSNAAEVICAGVSHHGEVVALLSDNGERAQPIAVFPRELDR